MFHLKCIYGWASFTLYICGCVPSAESCFNSRTYFATLQPLKSPESALHLTTKRILHFPYSKRRLSRWIVKLFGIEEMI